ncbi:efflux RND transporter periplasmic adaptor subunit [Planctomicrobium sp. SH668]|uniref:efflux RND transporter periplasmic adaptor subunit n=1 Tax=Planctomicrobium sp. SH668 TaxID=3448126 RepID=UPI003F5AE96C
MNSLLNSQASYFVGCVLILTMIAGCHHQPDVDHSEEIEASVEIVPQRFALSQQKQKAAGIETSTLQNQAIQEFVTAPGRVQYDDTNHIAIKAPTAGVIAEVRVLPGTQVAAGDVLAVMSSPEVGAARADIRKRQVEFELASRQYAWREAIHDGLKTLVSGIKARELPNQLSEKVVSLKLGSYREQVFTAYTRYRLAESLASAVSDSTSGGALSGKMVQERMSERDSSRSALDSIIEQSLFEATQDAAEARLQLDDSERRLKISQQQLQSLIGIVDTSALTINEDELSLLEIRAPFAGTVESRTYSKLERIDVGDTLFILANTKFLWISADIRENAWSALQLAPGETLSFSSPAIPGETLSCTLKFVGREVNPLSNAIPLVAGVQNDSGLLRPGQFVWVQLPIGKPRQGIAIPESAIVEHQGQTFVFRPDGDDQFERVDVKTGIHQGTMVEIQSGLAVGDRVVTKGAFSLKSEMLLEREE